VVQVGHVEHLQVDAPGTDRRVPADRVHDLVRGPGGAVGPQFVDLAADGVRPPGDLRLVAAERMISSGARPRAAQASSTRRYCVATVSRSANGTLNSSANRAASAGVRFLP
jgi:hypothetical protein